MSNGQLLYLSAAEVAAAEVKMSQVISALEEMFVEKGHGRVEMPPKPGIHTRPDSFIHAMPAYIPSLRSAGIKWVSGYPENYGKQLPYISGLLTLNDDETGIPYCVMDCTWITAVRTGAATAVAAKFFARPDSRTVGILACGVQGRSNLEALSCCFEIERVVAYDIIRDKAERYAAEVRQDFGYNVRIVENPEEAVREMDMVVTSGPILKHPSPVIEDSWFQKGAFGSAVDFDSYWKPEVLRNAEIFVTDDVSQLLYYRGEGYFRQIPPKEKIVDLGEVAAGKAPGRTSDEQRVIAVNLGLALDDMATAPLIYNAARKRGLGTWLDL